MTRRGFTLLYVACLLACTLAVLGARAALGGAPPPPSLDAPAVMVAIPPKPEGAAGDGGRGGTARTWEGCAADYTGDLRDLCFFTLARQRAPHDLGGALEACDAILVPRLVDECRSDVAELHAPTDLAAARALCPDIRSRKWRDQCMFGIALSLVSRDPPLALRTCDEAGMWRDFCRHDVLGEISLFDLDYVLDACGREEGDLLTRKSCWHGIGKYIGRQDPDAAFRACARVPPGPSGLYRENCVHGAGWALGERSGLGGAARCAGAEADSCRLGVAFQQRVAEPASAVELCRAVQRRDLREHCLAFVLR